MTKSGLSQTKVTFRYCTVLTPEQEQAEDENESGGEENPDEEDDRSSSGDVEEDADAEPIADLEIEAVIEGYKNLLRIPAYESAQEGEGSRDEKQERTEGVQQLAMAELLSSAGLGQELFGENFKNMPVIFAGDCFAPKSIPVGSSSPPSGAKAHRTRTRRTPVQQRAKVGTRPDEDSCGGKEDEAGEEGATGEEGARVEDNTPTTTGDGHTTTGDGEEGSSSMLGHPSSSVRARPPGSGTPPAVCGEEGSASKYRGVYDSSSFLVRVDNILKNWESFEGETDEQD